MAKSLPPLAELKEWLRYDANTGKFFWVKRPAQTVRAEDVAGSKDGNGYVRIRIKGTEYLAHRLAWLFAKGEDPLERFIDHLNCDRGDNRIENLRIVDHKENNRNRRKAKGTSSKFKGVSWNAKTGKWTSQIYAQGRQRYLGSFDIEEDAHEAYRRAAIELHGEFANFG